MGMMCLLQTRKDFTRLLLVSLVLGRIFADFRPPRWTQYLYDDCQLQHATGPLTIALNDSADHVQLFVKKLRRSDPSIVLKTSNNETHTRLNMTTYMHDSVLMSVRLLLSERPQARIGLRGNETITLNFDPKDITGGSAKEIVLQNVVTTKNCSQALPHFPFKEGLWEPILRDGKSCIGIFTTMETTVNLAIKDNSHLSTTFLLCWNDTDRRIFLLRSNDLDVKCPPLPSNLTHFLDFDYDKYSKEVKVNGIDAGIKFASRNLNFKPNNTEAKVYVVHDMQEFLPSYNLTSLPCEERHKETRLKKDVKGFQTDHILIVTVGALLAIFAAIITTTILYFKRRQRAGGASHISSQIVESEEEGRLHAATGVFSSQSSRDKDTDDIYEEMPPANTYENPNSIGTFEAPPEDPVYEEVSGASCETQEQDDAIYYTINDIYESLDNFQ